MKHCAWVVFLLAAMAANAATKITVDQLKEALVSMKQAGKSDEDVATRLKTFELSEELTHSAKNGLLPYLPGDQSNEQILILQARSAFLAPPASDVPSAPAPDATAQKAMVDKAFDFVNKTTAQFPLMSASRMTTRFQDDVTNASSSPGLVVSGPNTYVRLANAQVDRIETEHGIEKPGEKDKTPWGQNGLISDPGPPPPLGTLLQEASAGKLAFERWQMIGDKQVAVFSFAVDKKKSHYDVSYCCFPKTDTATGVAAMGTFVPVPGEIQSVTTYRPYKKTAGYHGELFIEPQSGTVDRVIAIADLKPGDYVHQEAIRMDYTPTVVDGTEYVLPLDHFLANEVVPGGESSSSAYSVRHMLFYVAYANYRMSK